MLRLSSRGTSRLPLGWPTLKSNGGAPTGVTSVRVVDRVSCNSPNRWAPT